VLTNDGWWKKSPGAELHFSYSRLRAIETRRSIARSANTGISGFINQRGDILKKTREWTRTAINAELQKNQTITFYTRYGDYTGRIAAFIASLLFLFYLSEWIKGKNKSLP
jgi:apolipoprotein N-acyltransferase